MYSKEALEALTVIELRKIARENSIPLSAGISKQGIVERLCGALIAEEKPETAEEPAAPAPSVRRAASIVADDEDTPVLTPNVPFNRSVMPSVRPQTPAKLTTAPPPGQPAVNRGNVPGTNKPVFSLEGVRAWHNPRTYQQTPGGAFTQPARAPQPTYATPTQQRPSAGVSRFGPDAVSSEDSARVDTLNNDPYRGDARPARPAAAYNADTRTSYPSYQSDFRARPAAAAAPSPALPELLASGMTTDGAGVLEIQPEGHGYLRTGNYLPGSNDIYVSVAQIRRFHLRTGDYISGKVRPKRENETHAMLLYITEINGIDSQDVKPQTLFELLTPVYPTKQMHLSKKQNDQALLRAIDLVAPIGFGQRSVIVAPPRTGKSALLNLLANAIHAQYPQAQLLTLLLGERPEDITAACESFPGEVVYASFAESAETQSRIASLILNRATRLAEHKQDVVLLVDSLTALCRAYNENVAETVHASGNALIAGAMAQPKKFFGSARALREGGSLTIIAAVLKDTGIALDEAICEEFRGTANMELYLTADGDVDLSRSNTRNAENMLTPEGKARLEMIRKLQKTPEGVEKLSALLSQTTSNEALYRQLSSENENDSPANTQMA